MTGAEDELHHYRVTRVFISTESHTITTTTPAEALKKTATGEGGVHAGAEGPVTLFAVTQDRAVLGKPMSLQDTAREIMSALQLLSTVRQQAQRQAAPPPPVGAPS